MRSQEHNSEQFCVWINASVVLNRQNKILNCIYSQVPWCKNIIDPFKRLFQYFVLGQWSSRFFFFFRVRQTWLLTQLCFLVVTWPWTFLHFSKSQFPDQSIPRVMIVAPWAPGWVSQLRVWLLVSAGVTVSQFAGLSPTLASALMLWHLFGIFSLSLLLYVPTPLSLKIDK